MFDFRAAGHRHTQQDGPETHNYASPSCATLAAQNLSSQPTRGWKRERFGGGRCVSAVYNKHERDRYLSISRYCARTFWDVREQRVRPGCARLLATRSISQPFWEVCSCSIHHLFLPRCVAVLLLPQTHRGRGRASFRYYNDQFMGWCDVGVASPLPRGECVCVLCVWKGAGASLGVGFC